MTMHYLWLRNVLLKTLKTAGPLCRSQAVLMESPGGWAPLQSRGLPLPVQQKGLGAVPETADQAAQPFRNSQLCGAPAPRRERLAECLPGPVKLGD